MKQNDYPKTRQHNLVVQDLAKEILIYDLKNNKAFCLNETSALVWQFSNGLNSAAEIANLMSKKMRILVTEDFVWLALDQLKKDNLLENSSDFEINFNGLNRRQVIKKIGFASMIALPLISSVIAPPALTAASLIGLGGACATSPQCTNNNCVSQTLFGTSPRCCVSGSTDTIQPGLTYLACRTFYTQTDCDNSANICCSNAGTLTQGACAPSFFTCRCNPFS